MTTFSRGIVSALLSVSTSAVFAQTKAPVAKLQIDKGPITAGGNFKATLTVTFAEGLHGYQNPSSDPTLIPVEVKAGDKIFTVVTVAYPKGVPTVIAGEDKPINIYSGTIKIPVTIKAPAKTGKTPLKLVFSFQQCNDKACFPPSSVNLETSVVVKAAKPEPKVGG